MKDLLYLKDDQIKDFIEQIFYAYRETFSDPRKILKKYSFGTAHHRAIHIIERHKGITISGLLNKLKITKQSLNRVLRDLIKNKSVLIKKGEIDSRQRHIFLNEKGKKLFDEIFLEQKKRIYTALKNSDSDSVIKFKNVLPYFPVCQNCDKLYTTESYEYIEDEKKVRYRCKDSTIGYNKYTLKGCGHEGEAHITNDLGKLAWKVEFAARWQAFDIRFEAHGKDIMDSVKVNDWVSDQILEFPHPHHVKYEMFLDKGGKKISKSLGNVVTSQKWLTYGTPKSILLLLYKRITGAREVGFEDIPALMDEYNELESIYFGKTKVDNEAKLVKSKGLYEYVNLLRPPENPSTHVSYRLLVELCKIFKDNRIEYVTSKLIDYGTIKEEGKDSVEELIKLAGNYSDDFEETKIPATKITVDDSSKVALKQLADLLQKDETLEDLQNSIYSIAKENQVQPKDFFKILYQIILSKDRGPKIGPFIEDIGKKKVADAISKHI